MIFCIYYVIHNYLTFLESSAICKLYKTKLSIKKKYAFVLVSTFISTIETRSRLVDA